MIINGIGQQTVASFSIPFHSFNLCLLENFLRKSFQLICEIVIASVISNDKRSAAFIMQHSFTHRS